MENKNCLICDYVPNSFIDGLKDLGFVNIDYKPEVDMAELMSLHNRYGLILIKSALKLHIDFFDRFSEIRLVLRPGSGLDNVNLKVAEERGVVVINSPEGNANAVGEHAVGLMLCLANNLYRAMSQSAQWKWSREPNRGFELGSKTIGVIGLGNTGTAVVEKLRGFGARVLGYDKYKKDLPRPYEAFRQVDMEEVFEEADLITLHIPLTTENKHWADTRFFERFRKPIYFVNASRGKVCSQVSLLKALERGEVVSAALDVLENEKFETYNEEEKRVFQALINSERVLITPHIAGWTHEAKEKMHQILLDKLAEVELSQDT